MSTPCHLAAYPSCMRVFATLICLAACSAACFGQATQHPATPDVQLAVTDYGKHFFYSISHPELVREAWIEVLDRPLLLAKKSVAVKSSGVLDWDWDRRALNVYEQPEDDLAVSIWDPNGENITCDAQGVMTSNPGGIVTWATLGVRSGLKFRAPYSHLNRSWVRAAQGGAAFTFDVEGHNLSPSMKLHVGTLGGGSCDGHTLHAHVLDLAHAHVTLGADCLRKAGILIITADDVEGSDGAVVHVASRTSPSISSISPSSIPDDVRQDKLRLVLHGRGFTKESTVYLGYTPDDNDFQTEQLSLETEYVSPRELRVHVETSSDDTVVQPSGENLRLWVKGREEKFELSEAREVALRPTGRPVPTARLMSSDFRRWKPRTAVITSVSPLPIKLMNEHSPEALKVTIHGENFAPEDRVRFAFGDQVTNDQEVRSEYISPNSLHAWLPRQLWRKHALSYRLVVKTTVGQSYTRQVDEKDER
jgi:hypothetical protein